MSRADHVIARRSESARKVRQVNKVTQLSGYRFVDKTFTSPTHKQGNQWWREKYADLVERRQPDGSYASDPKVPRAIHEPRRPEMMPRPEGMSRQVHRLLYRKACKLAGVPWHKEP